MRFLLFWLASWAFAFQTPAPAPVPVRKPTMRELSDALEIVTTRVSRSVVKIEVSGYGVTHNSGSGNASLITRQTGTGSGFIIDPEGYVVTNFHVVEGALHVKVVFPRNLMPFSGKPTSTLEAKIVGVDRDSDLALLKVNTKALPALRLADSDILRAGQLVLAFGSPLGLQNSVSMGVISAAARQIEPDGLMVYIQTDAPINPGNSGGPLVDADGNVIGINTFILSQSGGSEGVGFAIPSNTVRSIYRQLRKNGHVHRGEIGVALQAVTPILYEGLGLATDQGLLVGDLLPDGPADRAGLQVGDVITTLDGRSTDNLRQFEMAVMRHSAKDKIKLEVLHEKEKRTIEVEVMERPEKSDKLAEMVNPKDNLIPQLGILAINLDKNTLQYLPALRDILGVVVAAASGDGSAVGVVLQPGDVIHAMNGVHIVNVQDLRGRLERAAAGSPIVLQIERSGRLRFVDFTLE